MPPQEEISTLVERTLTSRDPWDVHEHLNAIEKLLVEEDLGRATFDALVSKFQSAKLLVDIDPNHFPQVTPNFSSLSLALALDGRHPVNSFMVLHTIPTSLHMLSTREDRSPKATVNFTAQQIAQSLGERFARANFTPEAHQGLELSLDLGATLPEQGIFYYAALSDPSFSLARETVDAIATYIAQLEPIAPLTLVYFLQIPPIVSHPKVQATLYPKTITDFRSLLENQSHPTPTLLNDMVATGIVLAPRWATRAQEVIPWIEESYGQDGARSHTARRVMAHAIGTLVPLLDPNLTPREAQWLHMELFYPLFSYLRERSSVFRTTAIRIYEQVLQHQLGLSSLSSANMATLLAHSDPDVRPLLVRALPKLRSSPRIP